MSHLYQRCHPVVDESTTDSPFQSLKLTNCHQVTLTSDLASPSERLFFPFDAPPLLEPYQRPAAVFVALTARRQGQRSSSLKTVSVGVAAHLCSVHRGAMRSGRVGIGTCWADWDDILGTGRTPRLFGGTNVVACALKAIRMTASITFETAKRKVLSVSDGHGMRKTGELDTSCSASQLSSQVAVCPAIKHSRSEVEPVDDCPGGRGLKRVGGWGADCEWDWQVMGLEEMGSGGAWGKRMQRRGWQRSGSAIAQLEEYLEFSLLPFKRQAFNVSHYEEDLLSSASPAAARSDRCAPKMGSLLSRSAGNMSNGFVGARCCSKK